MLLIEADGKALLSGAGIAVPDAIMFAPGVSFPHGRPWIVKAQVPVGGRGKAGGVRACATVVAVENAAAAMLGSRIKGHDVHEVLVEHAIDGEEAYLAMMLDPAGYGVRVLFSASGGIDIEDHAPDTVLCAPEIAAIVAAATGLFAQHPARAAIADVARRLASLLLERELMLAEINPLFLTSAGAIAGDAKIVVDLNAVDRQPAIMSLIAARPAIYRDACRKIEEGFDYVELDPQGEIGLVTTGAGLSMMLIDEMTARGFKPLNFCDIRTGQFRGSPARLIRVLSWIAERPSVKVILVNIFAGITDLGEFAGLLADAVTGADLRVPIVARLVGNRLDNAREILAQRLPGLAVEEDLEAALAKIAAVVRP